METQTKSRAKKPERLEERRFKTVEDLAKFKNAKLVEKLKGAMPSFLELLRNR